MQAPLRAFLFALCAFILSITLVDAQSQSLSQSRPLSHSPSPTSSLAPILTSSPSSAISATSATVANLTHTAHTISSTPSPLTPSGKSTSSSSTSTAAPAGVTSDAAHSPRRNSLSRNATIGVAVGASVGLLLICIVAYLPVYSAARRAVKAKIPYPTIGREGDIGEGEKGLPQSRNDSVGAGQGQEEGKTAHVTVEAVQK